MYQYQCLWPCSVPLAIWLGAHAAVITNKTQTRCPTMRKGEPALSVLQLLKQEDHKLEVDLSYMGNSKPL